MGDFRFLLTTNDYAGTLAFYGDTLGLAVHDSWDDPDDRGTVFRAAAGMIEVFEDSPHHPAEAPRGVRVAIEVDDALALEARLRAAGVPITDPLADRPWGHRSFTAEDPNGLPLTFFTVI